MKIYSFTKPVVHIDFVPKTVPFKRKIFYLNKFGVLVSPSTANSNRGKVLKVITQISSEYNPEPLILQRARLECKIVEHLLKKKIMIEKDEKL